MNKKTKCSSSEKILSPSRLCKVCPGDVDKLYEEFVESNFTSTPKIIVPDHENIPYDKSYFSAAYATLEYILTEWQDIEQYLLFVEGNPRNYSFRKLFSMTKQYIEDMKLPISVTIDSRKNANMSIASVFSSSSSDFRVKLTRLNSASEIPEIVEVLPYKKSLKTKSIHNSPLERTSKQICFGDFYQDYVTAEKSLNNFNDSNHIPKQLNSLTSLTSESNSDHNLRENELNENLSVSTWRQSLDITNNSIFEQENVEFIEHRFFQSITHHELGTHLLRLMNDSKQPWYHRRDRYRLLNPWNTEEGLATINTYLNRAEKLMSYENTMNSKSRKTSLIKPRDPKSTTTKKPSNAINLFECNFSSCSNRYDQKTKFNYPSTSRSRTTSIHTIISKKSKLQTVTNNQKKVLLPEIPKMKDVLVKKNFLVSSDSKEFESNSKNIEIENILEDDSKLNTNNIKLTLTKDNSSFSQSNKCIIEIQVSNQNELVTNNLNKSLEVHNSEKNLVKLNNIKKEFLKNAELLFVPQALRYYAVCKASELNFKDLWKSLERYIPCPRKRFNMCCRVKRGISASDIGANGSEAAYYVGALELLQNLEDLDFTLLYSGQLDFNDCPKIRHLVNMDNLYLPRFLRSDWEKAMYTRSCRLLRDANMKYIRLSKPVITKSLKNKSREHSRSRSNSKLTKTSKNF